MASFGLYHSKSSDCNQLLWKKTMIHRLKLADPVEKDSEEARREFNDDNQNTQQMYAYGDGLVDEFDAIKAKEGQQYESSGIQLSVERVRFLQDHAQKLRDENMQRVVEFLEKFREESQDRFASTSIPSGSQPPPPPPPPPPPSSPLLPHD